MRVLAFALALDAHSHPTIRRNRAALYPVKQVFQVYGYLALRILKFLNHPIGIEQAVVKQLMGGPGAVELRQDIHLFKVLLTVPIDLGIGNLDL